MSQPKGTPAGPAAVGAKTPRTPLQDLNQPATPLPTTPVKVVGGKPPAAKPSPAKKVRRPLLSDGGTACSQVFKTTEVKAMVNVGDKVWCAERDGTITIRSCHSGEVEGRIGAKEINNVAEVEFCWALLYAEDLVWAGYSSGETRVYDPETFALVKELYQHTGGVYCLAYSNGYVFSGSNDFECFQWRARTFEFVCQYAGHTNAIRAVLVFGHTLVTASDDYTIRLWDIVTKECTRELTGHRGGVLALAKNGWHLWSASEDGTIRIWDLDSFELLKVLEEHNGRVTRLLRVGDKMFSSGVDRTLCCYHLDTFRVLGRYTEHQGYVNHLALVGVCTKYNLWSSSHDKTIRVWSCDADHRYASEGAAVCDAQDSAELHRALLDQLEALRAQAGASEGQQRAARQQWEAEHQKVLAEQEALSQAALRRATEETESLRERLEELQHRLQQKDAEVAGLRRERQEAEAKHPAALQAKDEEMFIILQQGPFAQAIFPHLRLLEARLRTFWCWRAAGCVVSDTVNPDTLAAAGFFHAPNSDHMDRTACFYCGEVLCDWQPDDVPRAEHRREMPRCHFARCGAWLSRRLGPGPGGVRSPGTPRRAALRGTTSVNAQPPSAATGGHLVAAVGRARRRAAQGRSVAVSGDQPSAPAVGRRERRASSSPVAGAASPAAPCEQRRREEPAPKRRGRPRKVAAAPRGACLMAKEADDGRATEPLPERKRHGLDRKEENGGLPTKRRRVSSEQRSTRQDTGRDTASKGKPVKHRLAVPPLHEQPSAPAVGRRERRASSLPVAGASPAAARKQRRREEPAPKRRGCSRKVAATPRRVHQRPKVPRQQLALERRALRGLSARAQRRLGPRRPGEAEAAYLRRFRELVARRAHALQKRSIADWRRRLVREMWECQPELNAPQFLAMGERGRATYVRNRRRYQSLLRRVQVWAGNLAPRLS